jgi:hypothetical protein
MLMMLALNRMRRRHSKHSSAGDAAPTEAAGEATAKRQRDSRPRTLIIATNADIQQQTLKL